MDLHAENELLTTADVARILRVSIGTVAHWRVKGIAPPALKLNAHMVRFPRRDFEAWLLERQEQQRGD